MIRAPRGGFVGLEALEGRRLLDGALPFESYFPEGFASAVIDASAAVENPTGTPVQYELHARYEFGERDQLVASGTLPAFGRAEHVLSRSGGVAAVRTGVPYALVLMAQTEINATLRHKDFGNELFESFTSDRQTEWSFGENRRDDDYLDFVLLYNPSDTPANATITMYGSGGVVTTATFHLEGQRRGGWSIRDLPNVPNGVYAAKVSSSGAIVAGQSQYHTRSRHGFSQIGTGGDGATEGFVPAVELERDFFARLNDPAGTDIPGQRRNLYVSILNANATQASSVTLTFVFDDNTVAPVTRTVNIPAGTRQTINLTDLTIPVEREFGILYRASSAVTVSSAVIQGQSLVGVDAATRAATTWTFGQGSMSITAFGRGLREDVYLFNPTASEVTISVDLIGSSGTIATVTKRVSALELEDVDFRDVTALIGRTDPTPFTVVVRSPVPIVSSYERRDPFRNVDFSVLGVPSGTVVSLGSVLAPVGTVPGGGDDNGGNNGNRGPG
jgi:hypothetical protein